jgi:glutamine synthetase
LQPTPKGVIEFAKENNVQIVDYRFIDLPGTWQHFSIPVEDLSEDVFQEGVGFDGSSIRGFQKIHESDMLLIPDPATAFLDPFSEVTQLNLICNVKDPITGQRYSRDPRYIIQKADQFLKSNGLADTAYYGPEAEFFIFDEVRYDQTARSGYYYIDSEEGAWNTGREEEPNQGYKPRHKEGYFPVPPVDKLHDLRSEMLLTLRESGVPAEVQHHEVATAGQAEIDIRFMPMAEMADALIKYKYIIKNVAYQAGKTVTFIPKPLFGDNGSGMHTHISLWKGGKNLFFDEKGYAGLSQMAIHFIGGILAHAPSVLAFAAPSTNSYRRLVPGFEAPVNLMYSQRNRSACVRIPMYSKSEKSKRIEFRTPDPSCNPYLAFPAMLMAGIDGIVNRIEPPAPIDKNLYELSIEERANIKSTPTGLTEVLDALEADHEYLLRGDVFTPDLIEMWLQYKREAEAAEMALRPHPYEFFLYYDC